MHALQKPRNLSTDVFVLMGGYEASSKEQAKILFLLVDASMMKQEAEEMR